MFHWFDTFDGGLLVSEDYIRPVVTAGGLLVSEDSIRPVVSVLTLAWYIIVHQQ
jgi:hypothetical protein